MLMTAAAEGRRPVGPQTRLDRSLRQSRLHPPIRRTTSIPANVACRLVRLLLVRVDRGNPGKVGEQRKMCSWRRKTGEDGIGQARGEAAAETKRSETAKAVQMGK